MRIVKWGDKWRVIQGWWIFKSWATFGDGCGNDTGIPVEYDTHAECENWVRRSRYR